jgi:hypothetical protein
LVVQNRDVRLVDPCGLEDVDHALGTDTLIDEVAHGSVEVLLRRAAKDRFLELLSHLLIEDDLVRAGPAVIEVTHKEERVAQSHLSLQETVTPFVRVCQVAVDLGVAILESDAGETPPVAVVNATRQDQPDRVEAVQE